MLTDLGRSGLHLHRDQTGSRLGERVLDLATEGVVEPGLSEDVLEYGSGLLSQQVLFLLGSASVPLVRLLSLNLLIPAASSIIDRRSSGLEVTINPMRPCSMME